MLKKQVTLLLILTLLPVFKLLAQNRLSDPLEDVSQVREYRIRQVTEHWFHDSLKTDAANTRIEKYSETGQLTQRMRINYLYNKFIENYAYNPGKNLITETTYSYDWNPYQRKKGDTLVKKTVSKYELSSGRNLKTKPGRLEQFQPKLIFDDQGRLTERTDTIKCGHEITRYSYHKNGQLIERRYYRSIHSEEPHLDAVDSLRYDDHAQLAEEINYCNLRMNGDKWESDRQIITTYRYAPNGLLVEKTKGTKYPSVPENHFVPSVYRYDYQFY